MHLSGPAKKGKVTYEKKRKNRSSLIKRGPGRKRERIVVGEKKGFRSYRKKQAGRRRGEPSPERGNPP